MRFAITIAILLFAGCFAPDAPPRPPLFDIRSLSLDPIEIRDGESVNITFEVINAGGDGGDNVGVRLSSDWVDYRFLELASNDSQNVTIRVKPDAKRDVSVVARAGEREMERHLSVLDRLLLRPGVYAVDTGWCRDGAAVDLSLTNDGAESARSTSIDVTVKTPDGRFLGRDGTVLREILPGATVKVRVPFAIEDRFCGRSEVFVADVTVTTGLGHVYKQIAYGDV